MVNFTLLHLRPSVTLIRNLAIMDFLPKKSFFKKYQMYTPMNFNTHMAKILDAKFYFFVPSSKVSSLSTAQKMKFSIKDFFSKCDQIRRKLWI